MKPGRRRIVVGLAAGMAISRRGWAQTAGRTYRLAILQAGKREDVIRFSEGPFLTELARLGYAEGRNLTVDRRYAEGKLDALPALGGELVAQKPDLIYAPPAPAAAAVKKLTSTIPIVFCFVSDPVGVGFVQTLSHPGGNMTGMSNFSVEIVGKRIDLLREIAPRIAKLAVWYNQDAVNDEVERRAAEQWAARAGMLVRGVPARNPDEFAQATAATRAWGADSIYFNSNPVYFAARRRVVAIAAGLKVPAVYFLSEFADDGGLFVYAANFPDLARRTAHYADRILRGARPAELPVEQPAILELTLNVATARSLGLTIPLSLLVRADRIIGGS